MGISKTDKFKFHNIRRYNTRMDFMRNASIFYTAQWLTLFLGTAILIAVYYWSTNPKRKLEAQFPGLSGPKPLPFLGSLVDSLKAKGQAHLQFEGYYKQFGKLFSVYFIGRPCLVVGDPQLIRGILVKDFDSFHDRPKYVTKIPAPLDLMLTVARGDQWRRIRNTLSPTFSAHRMKMMMPLMNDKIDSLLEILTGLADSGRSFDIHEYQERLTLDIIMSCVFGINCESLVNPRDPLISNARRLLTQGKWRVFLLRLLLVIPLGRTLMGSSWFSKVFFGAFDPILSTAREMVALKRNNKCSGRKDMLDLMLSAECPDSGKQTLSDDEIAASCVIFLLAGYETSSTTLGLVCYHLATNPDVQDKLQEEIDNVWRDELQPPTYEIVHELPYLDMVISETLRLYPPGSTVTHEATEDCLVQGVKVPRGTPIIVPVYSIHRDPTTWPDPERFDPLRFSAEGKRSRDPFTYIPFGQGPHGCIGKRFAQLEIKWTIMRMIKKFTLKVAPETQIPVKTAIQSTLTTPDGVILKVSPRKVGDKMKEKM